MSRLCCYCHQA